ncbi:aldehyde dehydrogenase family protein [Pseudorhodoferax sp.]|uniref:aldehyde dehydrogenase family protein n=1 Tax=Pseudorhodoferax sp. TaxID=1993553 RepID=UPI0039E63AEC
MTETLMDVHARLRPRPGRLLVDGRWLDGGGARFEQIHPVNNRAMTTVEEAGEHGVNLAVAAARKAFDEGPWPRMPAQDRKRILQPIVERIYAAEEEAVRIANDSEYGLTGTVYTTDITRAFRAAHAIRSGSVGINGYSGTPNAPMGGVKRSGIGREGGWPAIEAFTELKTISINLDA